MPIEWVYLVAAGLLEPCWVITMEKSDGFRKVPWTAATAGIMVLSLYMLSLAMAALGPGTSYAVWTGVGAVCTMLVGILMYEEPATVIRILFISLIVVGIVGINLVSGGIIDG